jgi:hypothetical protein
MRILLPVTAGEFVIVNIPFRFFRGHVSSPL